MYNKARMKRALLLALVILTAAAAEDRVKLPNGRADLAAGKKLFENQCGLCHGPQGEGGRGPVLAKARLSRAPDDTALVKVIESGTASKTSQPMASDSSNCM